MYQSSTDSFVKKKKKLYEIELYSITILPTNARLKSNYDYSSELSPPNGQFLDTIYPTHDSAITCHPRFDTQRNKSETRCSVNKSPAREYDREKIVGSK